MPTTQPGDAGEATASRARMVAVAVSALQGLVLVGLGVFTIVETASGRADDATSAYLLAGLAVLAGGGLAFAAWSLWRGRSWGRGPVLAWQLIMLPVGYETLDTQQWLGVALLVSAVAALWALISIERDGPE